MDRERARSVLGTVTDPINDRCAEREAKTVPGRTEEHFHVWRLEPKRRRMMTMVKLRFRTKQGARAFAIRRGLPAGGFRVFKCDHPCPSKSD